MRNTNIPSIRPTQYSKEEIKLIADRKEWTRLYDYWLSRANRFALKLQAAGRPTATSKKYAELSANVKKYHTLLRDTLPAYKAMFVQTHK